MTADLAGPTPTGPVTADVGEVVPEVVHPAPAPDQHDKPEVDDPPPAPTEVVHPTRGRDLLAEGLAHRDPAVVAAAELVRLAVDQLATLLLRHPPSTRRRTP